MEYQLDSKLTWIIPLSEGFGAIGMGILLVFSWFMMPLEPRLPLGMLLPFLYILLRNIQNLRLLNALRGRIVAQWPYLLLVHDLVRRDNKPLIREGLHEFSGLRNAITFYSVSFTFGDHRVLDNISFSIPKGITTAIMGKSGVGKSTIVNLLMRFYDPLKGKVNIDGRSLTDFRLGSYRQAIGVVSQDTFIFNASVHDNINFGLEEEANVDIAQTGAEMQKTAQKTNFNN